MKEWLELFRKLGSEVFKKVKGVIGSDKAKEVIGSGEFGDNTVYIDKLAEDIIVDGICNSGMACSILTEEKGWLEVKGKYPIVIVDPIDGSLNAKRGIPYAAVSIGLAFDDSIESIECGYVINIFTGDEFWAEKHNGAYFNGKRIEKNIKDTNVIAVEGLKKQTNPDQIIKIFKSFYRVRQSGSTALDMCYTALGAYDAFLHLDKARIVDYAAGKIIIDEAGGGLFEWLSEKQFNCNISIEKTRPFMAVASVDLIGNLLRKLA